MNLLQLLELKQKIPSNSITNFVSRIIEDNKNQDTDNEEIEQKIKDERLALLRQGTDINLINKLLNQNKIGIYQELNK